jgi:hypothetical protein
MALIEFKGLVRAVRELAAAIRGDHRKDAVHPRVLREMPSGITVTRANPERRYFREMLIKEVATMGLTQQESRRRVAMMMKEKYDPRWRTNNDGPVPSAATDRPDNGA